MESVALIRGELPSWAASSGSGSGSGYGSGSYYGDGYGDGSGYGYSYGSGSGYGYCSGPGYGDGYGSGSGYGYGSGSCYGYGYDYGDGYGYGDGSGSDSGNGSYWMRCIQYFAQKWDEAQRVRLAELQSLGAKIAYWRSDKRATACNGGSNKPVGPGTVEKIPGPLKLCTHHALHATLIPPKWQGERWWIVALIGEVQGDDEKYGALEREVIGECL